MVPQQTPLFWSFPAGTWFQTRLRISIFFPLIIAVFCVRLGAQLGLVFGTILFVSVLLHEFGHIVAARMTGGDGREILIWPLGGLAYVQPAAGFRSQFLTPAGGPFVNVLLCLATLWPVIASEHTAEVFSPFALPPVYFGADWVFECLLLIFAANWILLLINLVPVFPLDGGRMLQAVLFSRMDDRRQASTIYTRIGFIVGIVAVIVGLFVDSSWVVAIGALVLVLNLYEAVQLQMGEMYDDTFMGYDFSQGYTSLERGDGEEEGEPRTPKKSWLARRREKKLARRMEEEQQQQREDEEQLDALLEKISTQGMEALTPAEKKTLDKVSARKKHRRD